MSNPNKTTPTAASVDAYLAAIEKPEVRADCERLVEIMQRVIGEPAMMWGTGIVGFGSYHYVYDSGREGDWCLTGFAARRGKISVYVMAGFEPFADLMSRLGKHSTGASCLYIKRLGDIDEAVLEELIRSSADEIRRRYG